MLTDNLSPNVPKIGYFALKSSRVVSFWGLHPRSSADGGFATRPKLPPPSDPLLKFLDPPLTVALIDLPDPFWGMWGRAENPLILNSMVIGQVNYVMLVLSILSTNNRNQTNRQTQKSIRRLKITKIFRITGTS